MKSLVIFLLSFSLISFSCRAQTQEEKNNTGIAFVMVSGASLLYGGVCHTIGATKTAPDVTSYNTTSDYKNALNNYNQQQKFFNISTGVGLGLAGLFLLLGANNLYIMKPVTVGKTASLSVITNKNGLGFCYKFK